MSLRDAHGHSLPAVHALELMALVRSVGVTDEQLLAGTGLSAADLAPSDARIPLHVAGALVTRAIALTGQPALGIMLGLRMQVPAHGYLGFAAMTAPTVRHALELAVRYAPTRTTALGLRLEQDADEAMLLIDELSDLGAARETMLFALAVGIWRIGEALTGAKLVGTAEFEFPRPSFAPPLSGSPFAVHYGRPHHCLRFSVRYLDLPLAMAQPSASLLAQEQCERALDALDHAGLVERVRGALPRSGGGVCTVDEVAVALGISARTLHRKLKAEGAVFSDIVEAFQQRQACLLLRDERISIDDVAERVGYSDVSNFARAFRRWTGESPATYRKSSTK